MESIAIGSKVELQRQTVQMGKIQGNLGSIQSDANTANRGLNEIKRAKARNRIIYYGVLGMIAVAVIVVIAVKFS